MIYCDNWTAGRDETVEICRLMFTNADRAKGSCQYHCRAMLACAIRTCNLPLIKYLSSRTPRGRWEVNERCNDYTVDEYIRVGTFESLTAPLRHKMINEFARNNCLEGLPYMAECRLLHDLAPEIVLESATNYDNSQMMEWLVIDHKFVCQPILARQLLERSALRCFGWAVSSKSLLLRDPVETMEDCIRHVPASGSETVLIIVAQMDIRQVLDAVARVVQHFSYDPMEVTRLLVNRAKQLGCFNALYLQTVPRLMRHTDDLPAENHRARVTQSAAASYQLAVCFDEYVQARNKTNTLEPLDEMAAACLQACACGIGDSGSASEPYASACKAFRDRTSVIAAVNWCAKFLLRPRENSTEQYTHASYIQNNNTKCTEDDAKRLATGLLLLELSSKTSRPDIARAQAGSGMFTEEQLQLWIPQAIEANHHMLAKALLRKGFPLPPHTSKTSALYAKLLQSLSLLDK